MLRGAFCTQYVFSIAQVAKVPPHPSPPTQYEETDKEMLVFLRPLYWKLDYKR